jgi:hypothetical protein
MHGHHSFDNSSNVTTDVCNDLTYEVFPNNSIPLLSDAPRRHWRVTTNNPSRPRRYESLGVPIVTSQVSESARWKPDRGAHGASVTRRSSAASNTNNSRTISRNYPFEVFPHLRTPACCQCQALADPLSGAVKIGRSMHWYSHRLVQRTTTEFCCLLRTKITLIV